MKKKIHSIVAVLLLGLVVISGCREVDKQIKILGKADQKQREQALMKLQAMGPKAKKALPALERAAGDQDPQIRRLAVEAMSMMGEYASPAAKTIVNCMEDKDLGVRRAAFDAFGRLGQLPSHALPLVADGLGDEDEIIRNYSMSIFVGLGRQSVYSLMQALEKGNTEARRMAVNALGMIGTDASRAEPLLRKVSETDSDEQIRKIAAKALKLVTRN